MSESISNSFFDDPGFGNPSFPGSPEDLFSILDALEGLKDAEAEDNTVVLNRSLSFSETDLEGAEGEGEGEDEDEQPKRKKSKKAAGVESDEGDGINKISHITVERNRRKQMNEHLNVLRSLMPCFYVKRGDQASIIGGVVDYINELQQVLQSLEAKKQRKVYSEVLSPSPRVLVSSPSPRRPPLPSPLASSPRVNLPISPRTPQSGRPHLSPASMSPSSSTSDSLIAIANSKSPVADVEVKFSGPNLLIRTLSPRFPGQVVKIISALEHLSLEILHISISTIEDTMINSFTIKIGIECQLSAEELAQQIQQTFCSAHFPFIINN